MMLVHPGERELIILYCNLALRKKMLVHLSVDHYTFSMKFLSFEFNQGAVEFRLCELYILGLYFKRGKCTVEFWAPVQNLHFLI